MLNIVPSLTPDEILSVVPRGRELTDKLKILFSDKGGIRVEDVDMIHDSASTKLFVDSVLADSKDEQAHLDRTNLLLNFGKRSMELWDELYNNADDKLRSIMEESNYNPCRETDESALHKGYRIDLIYNVPNALAKANSMKEDYKKLGYDNCKVLSAKKVQELDPYLSDFCKSNTREDGSWRDDAIALWRPGGCIDAKVFLPKLYEYLEREMGTYINVDGIEKSCFMLKFDREIQGVGVENDNIISLKFANKVKRNKHNYDSLEYVFAPGENVGLLRKMGFKEPTYARFAGASLFLDIPADAKYSSFSHCMEVHQEGIVLAWQARYKDGKVFIGVAGTKAFYGDQKPHESQAFCKDRTLLQLNMVNDVLPEFLSIALERDTRGQKLLESDLESLVKKGYAKRWVGSRAVFYDNVPLFGDLYQYDTKINNARATTGLGSGGASFGPASVLASRASKSNEKDSFTEKILTASSSLRTAQSRG